MDIIDWSRKIGNHNPSKMVDFISNLPDEAWEEFIDRQTRFNFHKDTRCVPAIFADRSDYPRIKLQTFTYTDQLSKLTADICESFCHFTKFYSYRITTAMLVKMLPNSEIGVHTDTHPYFGESHRLHWCLSGEYEKMDFLIAGNKIAMNEGDLIEINNRMPHSVVYRGETPRYNLIIDFMRQ